MWRVAEPGAALNATSAALLGLLHDGPRTGGQLVASAGERFGNFFTVTRSQVYRELPALTDAGLTRLAATGARSSQQYAITQAGRRAFKQWLLAGAEADQLRSPLVLRLVHAGGLTARQRADLVAGARRTHVVRLDRARAAARLATGPYERAAADFAVDHARAVLRLIDAIPI